MFGLCWLETTSCCDFDDLIISLAARSNNSVATRQADVAILQSALASPTDLAVAAGAGAVQDTCTIIGNS